MQPKWDCSFASKLWKVNKPVENHMHSISVEKTRNYVAIIPTWSVNRIQLKYGNSTEKTAAMSFPTEISNSEHPKTSIGVLKRASLNVVHTDESFRKLLIQVVPPASGKVQTYIGILEAETGILVVGGGDFPTHVLPVHHPLCPL